ncbi:unnamed protein product [Clonostachys rosea f. rosea IK726]|uniref:Uncharacterized protein n=1 Tax=Clonostachys rosea f. rosea IK726 TaxID=1349383 RepID=A0ACA9U9K1_BIOOC|nr:unnamed protein product [Clonostachys rosea f. rosea IK726]
MGSSKASGLAKDCESAAKTLKTFIDFLVANKRLDEGNVPKEAIANAQGLAIFSGFRAAMAFAGSGGSGIVIARLPDGSWSPPSAFSVKSGGIGLAYGLDVYDCLCVLNTKASVEAYTKAEMELGTNLAVAAGPVGATAQIKELKPVWTYTRTHGLYGGLTVDGTSIKERPERNAEFYGSKVTAAQILHGEVQAPAEAFEHTAKLVKVLQSVE